MWLAPLSNDSGVRLTTDTIALASNDSIPELISQPPPKYKTNKTILNRNVRDLLSVPTDIKVVSWRVNPAFYSLESIPVDSSLWMNHLFYPEQSMLETYTFLGNLGSPSQYDHFFSRNNNSPFLFARHHYKFGEGSLSKLQYNVRRPFTILTYSTAGNRRETEELFSVFHTQNINPNFNLGINYSFWGTKGVYKNQETRINSLDLFSSYSKGNIMLQTTFVNNVFKNQENGGVVNDYYIQDTIVETQLVPFVLQSANSIARERSFSTIAGYTFLNIKQHTKVDGEKTSEHYTPLISSKLILKYDRYSRTYKDKPLNKAYYSNFYISPIITSDSAYMSSWEAIALIEIAQFAKIPGMPGIRGWVGHQELNYYYFKPLDFIFIHNNDRINASHLGVVAYSQSPYFSYQGAMQIFFNGYRAGDKQLQGEVKISFWKDSSMPQLKGKILLEEREPDIFLNSYFSNHHMWENDFMKEKRFLIGSSLIAERWAAEIGYNLTHISDYIYFDQFVRPVQTANLTVTSAYIQKNLRLGGLNFFNRIVWQANTNTEVLSIPNLILFSSLFYQHELVKNALTMQLGLSVFFRSSFYADAYNPELGQFYIQRTKLIGNYPWADLFANFKWKRAIIYLKYEHLNQGIPNNQYFAAYHYPMNPQIFKFGLSWMFYD
jgi:hypothetical protein